MADGDFNLATLWVAVVPETSKVGPAMEDAGKEGKKRFRDGIKDFGHTITDDLEKVSDKAKDTFSHIGSSIKDTFSRSGSDAARGFESQFDAGSLGETIGQVLGTELGATLGEAIRQIPGMDTATTIFHDLGDSIISIKNADLVGTLSAVSTTLHDLEPVAKALGIDISGLPGPVQDTANKVATLAGNFGDAKKGVNQFADTVSAVSPGIADALGKWAAPIAAVMSAIDAATPALEHFFNIANDPSLAAPTPGTPAYDNLPPSLKNAKDRPPLTPQQSAAPPGSDLNLDTSTDVGSVQWQMTHPGWTVDRNNKPVPPGHQSGGPIFGPPSGTDTVPAWLTPGEFVIKKSTVDKYGMDFMKLLNASGFDGGGPVDDFGAASGHPTVPPPDENAIRTWVQQNFGIPNTFGTGSWENATHPYDNKWHHPGGAKQGYAFDFHGTPAQMSALANWIAANYKNETLELIYGGAGFDRNREIKNTKYGDVYGADLNAQHTDHVHWALTQAPNGGAGAGDQIPVGTQHDPLYVMQADSGTGGGGSQTQSQGQQLGQGLVDGLLQSVGLDGSVFKTFGGSSNPLQFGITRLATGMANVFGGMLNQQGGGGSLGGGGGSILPGLGGLIPHPGVVPVGPGGAQNVNTGDTHVYQGPVTVGPQLNVTQNGVSSPTTDLQGAANAGAARGQSTYGAGNLPAGQ